MGVVKHPFLFICSKFMNKHYFLNKNLVVWKMFIKFVAFKMYEQKQNSEHL